jgi:hypothetical protein
MNSQNIHLKAAMGTLLKMFYEDNLDRVARAVFKGNTIPSDNWSLINRVLMHLQNTEDARGFNQWKEAGRYVKKGCKAFYIIAPMFKKIKKMVETKTESGEVKTDKQIIKVLAGFKGVPVFRFEDTEGAPIVREKYKLNIPYEFNGIIKELGLKIDAVRYSGLAYGSYDLLNKQIELATPDIDVFLHELNRVVTNGTFRFVTTTEVFVHSRGLRHRSDANTINFHSPGVVFEDKGEINNERHTGSFYDNKEV